MKMINNFVRLFIYIYTYLKLMVNMYRYEFLIFGLLCRRFRDEDRFCTCFLLGATGYTMSPSQDSSPSISPIGLSERRCPTKIIVYHHYHHLYIGVFFWSIPLLSTIYSNASCSLLKSPLIAVYIYNYPFSETPVQLPP